MLPREHFLLSGEPVLAVEAWRTAALAVSVVGAQFDLLSKAPTSFSACSWRIGHRCPALFAMWFVTHRFLLAARARQPTCHCVSLTSGPDGRHIPAGALRPACFQTYTAHSRRKTHKATGRDTSTRPHGARPACAAARRRAGTRCDSCRAVTRRLPSGRLAEAHVNGSIDFPHARHRARRHRR